MGPHRLLHRDKTVATGCRETGPAPTLLQADPNLVRSSPFASKPNAYWMPPGRRLTLAICR